MTRVATAAVILTLLPAAALASKTLDAAQAAFDSLAVDEAAPLFEKALLEPATREERIKAWKGLGLSLAFMADNKGAQDAFERVLLIDPDAKIDTSLGPRVTKPWEAAKKAMKGKRASFKIDRVPKTGEVRCFFNDPMGLTSELRLFWRLHGTKGFQMVKAQSYDVQARAPADKDVEVYAQALDPQGGVLFEDGTETKFNSLPAVVRNEPEKTPDAVASAVNDAKKKSGRKTGEEPASEVSAEEEESSAGSNLPLYIGAAVAVIGGGVAVGYLVSRPPELQLAPADRTAQLPWRF